MVKRTLTPDRLFAGPGRPPRPPAMERTTSPQRFALSGRLAHAGANPHTPVAQQERLPEIVEGFFFRWLRTEDGKRVGRLLVKSPPRSREDERGCPLGYPLPGGAGGEGRNPVVRSIIRVWGFLNTYRPPGQTSWSRRWCGTGPIGEWRWRRCWGARRGYSGEELRRCSS